MTPQPTTLLRSGSMRLVSTATCSCRRPLQRTTSHLHFTSQIKSISQLRPLPPRPHPFTRHSLKQARAFPTKTLVAVVLTSATIYLFSSSSTDEDKILNKTTFVPYTITAREAISATSFIITIAPQNSSSSLVRQPPYLLPDSGQWLHPLWSVEFKQPQVQIARHYTPLPPLDDDEAAQGKLRFYIRAVGDGEMSNYLSRLRLGQEVWLRGPHVGLDLVGRLGDKQPGSSREVVFLAGGTGISPGLQAAEAVLGGNRDGRVTLLWAIRTREELQRDGATGHGAKKQMAWWEFWTRKQPQDLSAEIDNASPVGKQLAAMKSRYGERLRVQVAIDNENTQFQPLDIQNAVSSNRISTSPAQSEPTQGCHLHDQKLLERTAETEIPGATCNCPRADESPDCQLGKNLLFVSGPDGFIEHYAGPKVWQGGKHTQGPVGGVAGGLQRKDPRFAEAWLVLKL